MENQQSKHTLRKIIVWLIAIVIALGLLYWLYLSVFASRQQTNTDQGTSSTNSLSTTDSSDTLAQDNSTMPEEATEADSSATTETESSETETSGQSSTAQTNTTRKRAVAAGRGQSSQMSLGSNLSSNNPTAPTAPSTPAAPSTPTTPTTPAANYPSNIIIRGTPRVGQTLTAAIGDIDGVPAGGVSYIWYANDSVIGGATNESYQLTPSETGKVITVRATFTDNRGHAESPLSAATTAVVADAPAPNNPSSVTITGNAEVGKTLIARISDPDGVPDTSSTRSYQWYANGTAINNANSFSYTLTSAEKGKTITVRVSFTDSKNNQETATSNPTAVVTENSAPNNQGSITIGGINRVGQTFTANITDSDGVPTSGVTYQWYDFFGKFIGTGKTLTLTDEHIGMQLLVQADYTDNAGHQENLTSRFSGAVTAATSGGTGAGITSPASDAPKLTLSGPTSINEGEAAIYTVTLDKVSNVDVSADIAVAYGSSTADDLSVRWDMQRATVRAGETTTHIYVDTSSTSGNKSYSISLSNAVVGTVNQANVSPISTSVTAQSVFMLSHKYPMAVPSNTEFSDYWKAIHSAGSNKIPYVLINPSAGPDPTANPGYVKVLAKNVELGFKNIAYIRTNQQTRPIAEVKADVVKYLEQYGTDKIQGFYFDEISSRNNAATAYLAELYNYVKSTYGNKLVVANPGTHITDGISPYADIFMTNESVADEYINSYKKATSAFENNPANSHRIMHTIYDANVSDYQRIIDLSRNRNAGWVFISTDSIYPDGRPYNDLAENFSSLVDNINSLGMPTDPNGTALKPLLVGANLVTSSVTTAITDK